MGIWESVTLNSRLIFAILFLESPVLFLSFPSVLMVIDIAPSLPRVLRGTQGAGNEYERFHKVNSMGGCGPKRSTLR